MSTTVGPGQPPGPMIRYPHWGPMMPAAFPLAALSALGGAFPRVVLRLVEPVKAIFDKGTTQNEVESLCGVLSDQAGDLLHIEIRGEDIVRKRAQKHLFQAAGLILLAVFRAARR